MARTEAGIAAIDALDAKLAGPRNRHKTRAAGAVTRGGPIACQHHLREPAIDYRQPYPRSEDAPYADSLAVR